jgi:peptidoglycan/xylan/chitin deacetylase (PgdA/CDA1 family)
MVLMYHGVLSNISSIPNNRETGAELYDVSLDNFKAQMEWLKTNGYKATLIDEIKNDEDKKIAITFDDGEINNFHYAFPILKEFGWKAYFFIIVKRIGEQGYMGWEDLKKLSDAGMIIGSHGLTHEILTNLLESQMSEELKASKTNLEINLSTTIKTLSIPRGFCNDKVIQRAYQLGYKTVFISHRPSHLKSLCFSRVAVKANWSLKRFAAAINGKTPLNESFSNIIIRLLKTIFRESGYNWLRSLSIRLLK